MDSQTIVLISFWGGIGALMFLVWAAEMVPRVLPRLRQATYDAWEAFQDRLSPEDAREFDRALEALFATFDPESDRKYTADAVSREKALIAEALAPVVDEDHRCPRCAGITVRRHGRYGEFYGCTNYPVCRYTKSLPGAP